MDTRHSVFHYRPMAALALGVCTGIILSDILKGTWLFIAMCLLLCGFAISMKLGRTGWAVFFLCASLGLVRCMFPAFSLPIGIMAPFQYTREALTQVTSSLFGQQAPILQAMLWGYKGDISNEAYAAYRMSVIAHVLPCLACMFPLWRHWWTGLLKNAPSGPNSLSQQPFSYPTAPLRPSLLHLFVPRS